MRKLLLHIGHSRTGSSYIQSSLAGSGKALAAHRLAYALNEHMRTAATGRISSGNGSILLHRLKKAADRQGPKQQLFSSEKIFAWLLDAEFQRDLQGYIAQQDFYEVAVLLFIRDPVALACSSYQQMVKRSGNTKTLEEDVVGRNTIGEVNDVLDFLDTLPGATITIHNYSADRNVLPYVEQWLGFDPGSLRRPPRAIVNRSLTRAELELQRQLNMRLGQSGHLLADRFCNELPEIPADPVRPSLDAQEEIWRRLRDHIERVNSRVPEAARYIKERDIAAPAETGAMTLLPEQIAIVADVLAEVVDGKMKGAV